MTVIRSGREPAGRAECPGCGAVLEYRRADMLPRAINPVLGPIAILCPECGVLFDVPRVGGS